MDWADFIVSVSDLFSLSVRGAEHEGGQLGVDEDHRSGRVGQLAKGAADRDHVPAHTAHPHLLYHARDHAAAVGTGGEEHRGARPQVSSHLFV